LIVKCSHCRQILSEKDFETHECDVPLKECRRIEVVYFRDMSYEDKQLMEGMGVDGILYTFEILPRTPIPLLISLADEKKQEYRTDEEGTESERQYSRTKMNFFIQIKNQKFRVRARIREIESGRQCANFRRQSALGKRS
jgi:hypothetical protein